MAVAAYFATVFPLFASIPRIDQIGAAVVPHNTVSADLPTGASELLTRDVAGHITARSLILKNPWDRRVSIYPTDTFTVNKGGWILSESRGGAQGASYSYREDGVRASHQGGSRTAQFTTTGAGFLEKVDNAFMGAKLRAPVNGYIIPVNAMIGVTPGSALTKLVKDIGGAQFTQPVAVCLSDASYGDLSLGVTGSFADDFDSGTANAWNGGVVKSAGGIVTLTQNAVLPDGGGYAPRFNAGAGEYAYLKKTFASGELAGDWVGKSFQLYVSGNLPSQAVDDATVCRLTGRNGTVMLEIRLVYTAAGAVLKPYYQETDTG